MEITKGHINILPPVLLMILIFMESSIPMGSEAGSGNAAFLTDLEPEIQNFLHVPVYGLLAFLWQRGFQAVNMRPAFARAAALTLTVLYGCLDEVHQAFVPGRYAGMLDIGLNTVGAALGVLIYTAIHSRTGDVG